MRGLYLCPSCKQTLAYGEFGRNVKTGARRTQCRLCRHLAKEKKCREELQYHANVINSISAERKRARAREEERVLAARAVAGPD